MHGPRAQWNTLAKLEQDGRGPGTLEQTRDQPRDWSGRLDEEAVVDERFERDVALAGSGADGGDDDGYQKRNRCSREGGLEGGIHENVHSNLSTARLLP